nr:MAG TPA_asm: hypothetical protein [Caudoviricetes sp.]
MLIHSSLSCPSLVATYIILIQQKIFISFLF